MGDGWDWFIVAGLGLLVGVSELMTRYRQSPFRALTTLPSGLYLAVNVIASLAALALVRIFDWDFGGTGDDQIRATQVLVAGFGAILFFRTSFFTVRAGGQDIGIGPSNVLRAVLAAADSQVDRIFAEQRAKKVTAIMKDVDYAKAVIALPTYTLALFQNLSRDDQDALGEEVRELIANAEMDADVKLLTLGLALMTRCGTDVVDEAVKSLGDKIKKAPVA
jgi:hypothetical protein